MKKITKNVGGRVIDWFSENQLVEMFQPESPKVLASALSERQKEYNAVSEEIKTMILRVRKEAPQDLWFYEILAEKMPKLIPKLLQIENHIYRLKWELSILKRKSNKNYEYRVSFQEKILIARRYPIFELARSKLDLKPSGKNYVCLCFSHNEKTPSLYFYTETNTFVCFGCDLKGDVITLTMHLYGLSFRDTVIMLQN